jgi:hypothetical protein
MGKRPLGLVRLCPIVAGRLFLAATRFRFVVPQYFVMRFGFD